MESVQVHTPDTPLKTSQRQRYVNSMHSMFSASASALEDENKERPLMDVEETVEDCSGLTDKTMESIGSFDLNKQPVDEDQFANGFTAAFLQGEDCAREEGSASNLVSSQSSSDTVIPQSSSCGFGSIEGSFKPVPEPMSQYNLKNQELVDGKFCIGDSDYISILKRKLHDATLQRPRKRLKRPNKKVYRPKVVRDLGRTVPRMVPKTPTKKNKKLKVKTPKRKENVSLNESSSTMDPKHVPITSDLEPSISEREASSVDIEKHSEDGTCIRSEKVVECCIRNCFGFSGMGLSFLKKKKRTTIGKKWELKEYSRVMEPNLRKIQKKKRMCRRRMEAEKWQKIATKFQANYIKRRYNKKRRATPIISQKELQNIFDTKKQLSPCFVSQSGELNIEESLIGIISLLESDSLELLFKSTDTFKESISHKSNHGVLVCYQETEKHDPIVELGIIPHANGELGIVATTKKKGRRQEKLEKLEHGELAHPWKLQLQNGVQEGDKHDEEDSEFWNKERIFFRGRIDLFLTRMRIFLGNRKFSRWGGSVIDSIVGVFLTQNVSDHLSSSAFISLAAAFPCQPSCNPELSYGQSEIVKIEEYIDDEFSKLSQTEDIHAAGSTSVVFDKELFTKEAATAMEYENQKLGNLEMVLSSSCKIQDHKRSNQEVELQKDYHVDMQSDESGCSSSDIITNNSQSYFNIVKQKGKQMKADAQGINNIEGVIVNGRLDWDYYKRGIENKFGKERDIEHMDSVNWEAVRQADVGDIAEAIKGRGQHRIIAGRIKRFLNEVYQDHKEINLEWLRCAPAELVRTYLTNIEGIGLKSVECVRLLSLMQIAFPVDVNVGRIVIRIGWVPMQPLPEDVQLHLLEEVPVMDNIQKYLWPRLKKLTPKELYELHYQLITFGKVFCTKRKPNCYSCPMKNECKYYLSAYASGKHPTLPKSTEKQTQKKMDEHHEIVRINHLSSGYGPLALASQSYLEDTGKSEHKMKGYEPIIEEPASPERSLSELEYVETDIEDLFIDKPLNEFVTRNPYMNVFQGSDISSLIPFMTPKEASSIPPRILKEIERLRTKHSVYEIKDGSPLFKELKLERRHPKDANPYLFVMCTPVPQPHEDRRSCDKYKDSSYDGENTCLSCSSLSTQDDSHMVRGTILIPSRTATRGSFPLNGTYFQPNEVFADHESSINPIKVHRDLLWERKTRDVYFGTSASPILKGLSPIELKDCCHEGFICVRAFNQTTRTPEPLHERFHISTVKPTTKAKDKTNEEDD